MDKDVLSFLQKGIPITQISLLELVNKELSQDVTATKGFILDIPLTTGPHSNYDWVEAIISNRVKLPRIQCRYFSHII